MLLAFRFWCGLLALYSDDVGFGKAQAGCDHLGFDDHLPPLLPCLGFVGVIGHLSDDDYLESFPKSFSGVLGEGSERDDAVEDRREIVVLVGVPVEALAVDGHIKADDSAAVGRHPKYGVCRHVADDGGFVHGDAPRHDDGGTAVAVPPPVVPCSAVRLVVGVDDLLLDSSSSAHVHALAFSPCTDLRDVVAAASSATVSAPAVPASCSFSLPPHFAAVLNVGL